MSKISCIIGVISKIGGSFPLVDLAVVHFYLVLARTRSSFGTLVASDAMQQYLVKKVHVLLPIYAKYLRKKSKGEMEIFVILER